MGVFMKFDKNSFEESNGRHIRIVARTKSGVEDWFRVVGCLVKRLIRFVESSIKSCVNRLKENESIVQKMFVAI